MRILLLAVLLVPSIAEAQKKWTPIGKTASGNTVSVDSRSVKRTGSLVAATVRVAFTTPVQTPVLGSAWHDEDHLGNRVAQLYGGYLLPGSRFDIDGGTGLIVSQWNTATGWPYRAMQFKASLKDSTKAVAPPDP